VSGLYKFLSSSLILVSLYIYINLYIVHIYKESLSLRIICYLGCVYTTTISLVSAIISVLIVAVRPFVYTTTVKPFPVSANIRIRQRKRKNSYPGIFRRRVNSCSVVCLRWKKMDRRIIAAFLALLSTLIGIYSLAYKSIVFQSAYFLWKRQRLAHLALFSTRRRRQIRERRLWIRPGRTQGWWENFLKDN
jgi:hypothetical protein